MKLTLRLEYQCKHHRCDTVYSYTSSLGTTPLYSQSTPLPQDI